MPAMIQVVFQKPFDDGNCVDDFVGKVLHLCTDKIYTYQNQCAALTLLLYKLSGLYFDSLHLHNVKNQKVKKDHPKVHSYIEIC